MQAVRSVQSAFYQTTSRDPPAQSLDLSSGMIYHLPLWRVQWHEVPGRTNVLNVHEPVYTNLFETILHQPPPWYVGHLYLPDVSLANPKHHLATWQDVPTFDAAPLESLPTEEEASTVMGTLLRIADYRRLVDGRLLLLVQAMVRV